MSHGAFQTFVAGFPIPYPNIRCTQPATYDVLTPPATLPVTLVQVKEQLRLLLTDAGQDSYLTTLIEASRDCFEAFTGRILINTQFRTFFDMFKQSFELRKSKLQSLDAFQYSVNNAFIVVPATIYYNTFESIFSRIIISDIDTIPENKDDIFQSIRADFTAGYGALQTDVPADIQLALLQQITDLYENRGDCSACDCSNMNAWPAYTAMTYNKYRIKLIYGSSYRG